MAGEGNERERETEVANHQKRSSDVPICCPLVFDIRSEVL